MSIDFIAIKNKQSVMLYNIHWFLYCLLSLFNIVKKYNQLNDNKIDYLRNVFCKTILDIF